MEKTVMKRSLFAIGLLVIAGAVGAETYHHHQQELQLKQQQAAIQSSPWGAMQTRMDRMYNQMMQEFQHTGFGNFPGQDKITMQDKGNDYVVTARINGAKQSDVKVNLNGQLLSISSRTESDHQKQKQGKVVQETSSVSSFQHAFTLPGPVNASGMQSQYNDGVLTITIPKATS